MTASVWESADKSVKKEIMHQGVFSKIPATDLSVCTIKVDNLQSPDMTIEEIKNTLNSQIVDVTSKKVIVIGESSSTIDRLIERAVRNMCLSEQSLVTVQVPLDDEKSKTVVISLQIVLEAVEIHEPIWEWSPETKYETALQFKEKGVELFKAKRYIDAFYKFSRACKVLITLEPVKSDEHIMQKIINLKYILYNNIAECQLIRKNYEHVITLCNKVLTKEENNVKALYRRGVAYGSLRDFEKATNDLKTVVLLQPNDKKAQEKYTYYSEQWRISVQGYENMVRKMFKT